jgi:drug/metabolite transporter (DMT)-like permease
MAVALAVVRPRVGSWRRLGSGTLWAGGCLAAGYWLQTAGLERTSASASGLVTSLYLPAVPVIVALLTRRAPTWPQGLAVALATTGLVLIALKPDLTFGAGDLLTAAGAVAFAGQIVALDRYSDVPPLPLTAGQVAVCAAVSAAALPLAADRGVGGAGAWAAILYTGALVAPAAFFLQTWAQRRTPPVRTGILFGLEAVFAVALSAIFLDERLTALAWLGALLVLCGIAASAWRPETGPSGAAPPRTATPPPPRR